MISIIDSKFYDSESTSSSTAIAFKIDGLRFDTRSYLAIFSIHLMDGTKDILKIPVNKLGMFLIGLIINARHDSVIEISIDRDGAFKVTNDWEPVQVTNYYDTSNQYKFMVDMLQSF